MFGIRKLSFFDLVEKQQVRLRWWEGIVVRRPGETTTIVGPYGLHFILRGCYYLYWNILRYKVLGYNNVLTFYTAYNQGYKDALAGKPMVGRR